MNSDISGVFHQMLVEEYERRKDQYLDVVAMKRQNFNTLLEVAHNELRNKSYAEATKCYYNLIQLVKVDPYPDEFQLSRDTDFAIKCCFCYSGLMDPDRFKDDNMHDALVNVIRELNDKFRTRLFPMFLLVLLNFHKKDWLSSLTWCNDVVNCNYLDEEDGKNQVPEFFKELLPDPSQIMTQIEACEHIAYFGYGEKLTRNALLKPKLEKYKSWVYKLDDFIANRISKLKPPISEMDLHTIFHHEIFPLWCLSNGKECTNYFSEKFATKCLQCMRGKLYESFPEDLVDDRDLFEKYVDKCVELYRQKKHSGESLLARLESNLAIEPQRNETKDTSVVKKKLCSVLSQTDKVKSSNKIIQTDACKTRNSEVQVSGNDSQVLNAIWEIKNKCMTLQEKKEETISKLNRKISELQEKINKEATTKKNAEQEVEKQITSLKFETHKLKDQLAEEEKKLKNQADKTVSLQALLIEQNHDKFSLYKNHYKFCEKQSAFMVAYLKDLEKTLTATSIPSLRACQQSIGIWENRLWRAHKGLDQLTSFYQKLKEDVMKSDLPNAIWPELPELPRLEENFILINFKSAISNIIHTEEKLYWKIAADFQNHMQQTNSLHNYPANVQRPQFLPQNSMYAPPRFVYSTTQTVQMQHRPQLQQVPTRNVPPLEQFGIRTVPAGADTHSEQNRTSRSVELFNRAVGTSVNPAEMVNQESQTRDESTASRPENDTIVLDYVMQHCSGATEEDVTLALLDVLKKKGTLSCIPKEQLINDVKHILGTKKQSAWVMPKSPHVTWHKDDAEKECSICFEEFSSHDTYTLSCQHSFHKECIRKWLKTSSICPICRIHCIFDEEFPPLH
ncbi:hypothetical protein NQ315_002189 [Exocentrus adspersus]|uniref:RING-type domain-containing protein n=1 Tax=Exocentrus adspersus TaxID=1586481 RepID=A0AAV8W0B2_9CUCU|nr:hypothetical protein NQ315_002189 [Exocentrus adspersus]